MQTLKAVLLFYIMMSVNGTTVKWKVSRFPVIFGQDLKLICKISNITDFCNHNITTWFGGRTNKFLSLNGRHTTKFKYMTVDEDNYSTLIIRNLTTEDVNQYYKCSYCFHGYRKKLKINGNFENLPTNDTMTVNYNLTDSKLNVNLQFRGVHPKPNCSISYKAKDLSLYLIGDTTNDQLFYNTEFNLNYNVRAEKCGTLKVNCTVGTSSYELINKNIHDKHNGYDDGCLPTTQDPWNYLMVIIPCSVIVICIIVILVFTKWRNRFRGHHPLPTFVNDQ